jgi:hypothetical protein
MRLFARLMVAYGCLGFIATCVWWVATLVYGIVFPKTKGQLWVVAAAIVIATMPTFHQWYGTQWPPMTRVTPATRTLGRLAVTLAVANMLFRISVLFRHQQNASVQDWSLGLNGMTMLLMTYVVVHWTLRPENVFPKAVLEFASHGLFYPFILIIRRREQRKRDSSS